MSETKRVRRNGIVVGMTASGLLGLAWIGACRGDWQGETPFTPGQPHTTPRFGATVQPANPPPPVSGGTLTIGRDGVTAVAADPDRDHVYVVDLASKQLVADLALQPGDEPGRVIEAGAQHFYVALRRGGAIVHVDAAAHSLGERIPVCAAPRGLAADVVNGTVHVACAGGELVTIRTADGSIARTLQLGPDLRDVVLNDGVLHVTRFRSAEGFEVGDDGSIRNSWHPLAASSRDAGSSDDGGTFDAGIENTDQPEVAWRAVAAPGGGVIVAHQFAANSSVDDATSENPRPQSAPYGSGRCGSIVSAAVTWHVGAATRTTNGSMLGATLPVDIAVAHRADRIVVVAAGNAHAPQMEMLYTLHAGAFGALGFGCGTDNEIMTQPNAQPIAAAFDGSDNLVVQTREPASLYLVDQHVVIPLSNVTREDTGHAIFHSNSGFGIACASCHPEGGDDGHVWNFTMEGRRRTQSLAGGIGGTEPFHWDGALADMTGVSSEIFQHRMGGPLLESDKVGALNHWVASIPRVPVAAPQDAPAVERGRALFEDSTVGCATCHSGAQGTNNQTVDVGTGRAFQVPRLTGIALRAPFMHDGCAATLRDRFGACGGGDAHGHTSQLAPAQIDDLVAYLQTL